MDKYDVAIVGGGPAAWSAAMTCRQRNLSTLMVAPKEQNGWLARAEKVENYPGLPAVAGRDLLCIFEKQALSLGTEKANGIVRNIVSTGRGFMLMVENEIVQASGIILCLGAARPKLLEGEEENLGRGVSYCATCDGMLYKGKDICVLAYSQASVEEANYLASLANVTYFPARKHDMGELNPKAKVRQEEPIAISRDNDKLVVNTKDGAVTTDGVFIFRPAVALSQLIPKLQVNGSFIEVDRSMATNLPGVFAAGDCTGQPLQIAKAVGEGNVAALSCAAYVTKVKGEQ